MKILYICSNERSDQFPWLIDYQNDSLLYGLKELFGDDVVDVNRRHNLYWDYSDENVASEYGRGFTYTRLLDSDKTDRDDITKKIKNKYFDLVIYGSAWRCLDYHELVLENYKCSQIIYVDGEDSPKFNPVIKQKGLYFKRELMFEHNQEFQDCFNRVSTISFAFPTKKITLGTKKDRKLAYSDPRDRKTYVFNKEIDYYQDYQFSKFAITMKKAGWDAMRHYEIMGNGCVPLFLYMPECPRTIMYRFPKALLTKFLFFYENNFKWLEKNYDELSNDLFTHFKKFNTTKALGEYLIKDIDQMKRFFD